MFVLAFIQKKGVSRWRKKSICTASHLEFFHQSNMRNSRKNVKRLMTADVLYTLCTVPDP